MRCSPWLPGVGRSARTVSRSGRPGAAFRRIAQRRGVGDAPLHTLAQEAHEGYAVVNLELGLFVGKIVQRLHDEHAEQNNSVNELAPGAGLLIVVRRYNDSLDVGAKALSWCELVDRLKRITLLRQQLKPSVGIDKEAAITVMLEKYEVVRAILHGQD